MKRGGREEEPAEAATPLPRPSYREIWLLAFLLLAGAALRGGYAAGLSVEHFDEGVYASNIWFGAEQNYRYPARHLYAPPLLPALIEWGMILGLPVRLAPFAPSLVAGSLTPLLVWWAVRQSGSSTAAVAAATLAAFSEPHILYSRAALTDVPLAALVTLAVTLGQRTFRHLEYRWALGAGLATAAAWWTKYNGWLPLVILGTALLAWWILDRGGRASAWRQLRHFVLLVLTACVAWLPVWYGLQAYGGYAAVAANHRNYVVGWSGWWESLQRQYANLNYLEGPLTRVSLIAAVVVVMLFEWQRRTPKAAPSAAARHAPALLAMSFFAVLLSLAATMLGTSATLAALALVALSVGGWRSWRSAGNVDRLGFAIWSAWWVGLSVATPLYWPYPRLVLPWLVASWMGAGYVLEGLGSWFAARQARDGRMPGRWPVFASSLLLAAALGGPWAVTWNAPATIWQPRHRLELISEGIAEQASSSSSPLLLVYGEPAIFYHTAGKGLGLVLPIQDLQSAIPQAAAAPVPAWLVAGPHALRSGDFVTQWGQVEPLLELVATYPYAPSPLVILDQFDPRRLPVQESLQVRLYRVKSTFRDAGLGRR